MKRSDDRILTTHTGKLFRPGAGWVGMIEATTPSTPAAVHEIVEELVAAQLRIGLDVISNGEPAGMGPFNRARDHPTCFLAVHGVHPARSCEPVQPPKPIRFDSALLHRRTMLPGEPP